MAVQIAEANATCPPALRVADPVAAANSGVVTIAFPFRGGVVGGSHISAMRLIQQLDPTRYRPLVMLHRADGPVGDLFRAEGLEITPLPFDAPLRPRNMAALGDVLRLPARIWRMTAFLVGRKVRIVHTNEGAMHASWALPAAFAGARHIWHHRANPTARGLSLLAPIFADRVIAVSHYAAPAPGLFSARDRTSIIYSPFDPSLSRIDRAAARTEALRALGLPPRTAIVSYIGHFAERKRPRMFVSALAEFHRQHPGKPVVGLIFGHEEAPGQAARLEQEIEAEDAAGFIRIMGFRRPIENWIAGSDVLLVPAVEEPFGRTLVEAMLIGTPIVAAASGGNIEAIDHGRTGMLATPDDAGALASALADVLLNPDLARWMGARARNAALLKFDTERHVRSVEAVYGEVLAR